MAKVVSRVYGDALFSLATEGDFDTIWNEVAGIRDVLVDNPTFVEMLTHPEMTQERRLTILDEVFKEKVSDDMMGFLHVLVHKGRLEETHSILDYFDEKAKEYKKIGVVKVTTPMPLTNSQKQQIEKKILEVSDYETLEMHYEQEESLLGGIVIRMGDHLLDNSIRTKLDNLSRQLMKVKL